MKRAWTRLCISLLFGLLLACVGALAEAVEAPDMPVNPYYSAVQSFQRLKRLNRAFASTGLSVELVAESGEYFVEDNTWTFAASGGDGSYRYQFFLVDENDDPHGYQGWSDDPTFTYRLIVPGYYEIWTYVTDGTGASSFCRTSFNAMDDARVTVSDKVDALVAECEAAGCEGEFEKAVWLHDWLTHNARYDYTYSYYSADGVLLRGTGVCDSYSKAYVLLLQAAGVECGRVTGGNHAWNIVLLDGDWYQVDPTWDDPGKSTEPFSGFENHQYFGLPDAIMSLDHIYIPDTPCTSYASNYYIRTGKVSAWTEPLRQSLASRLDDGVFDFAIDAEELIIDEGEAGGKRFYGKGFILYHLCCRVLEQEGGWSFRGLQPVPLALAYDDEADLLAASMDFTGQTLCLPAALTVIESEAFMGGDFLAVELSDVAQRIDAGAVRDCGRLWKICIPASCTYIDATALPDNGHLTIVCPAGSYAETFAVENGYHCITQ